MFNDGAAVIVAAWALGLVAALTLFLILGNPWYNDKDR